jgi:NitT/TauT family transport system ATP-binding protein
MNTFPHKNIPILELRGVRKYFDRDTGNPLRVLEDINLDVRPNEVIALLGPSGCGKSTILRIFAGLIKPTKGQVRYRGKKLEGLNSNVSIVFQGFALYPWMTVEGNVSAVLKAKGLGNSEVQELTT